MSNSGLHCRLSYCSASCSASAGEPSGPPPPAGRCRARSSRRRSRCPSSPDQKPANTMRRQRTDWSQARAAYSVEYQRGILAHPALGRSILRADRRGHGRPPVLLSLQRIADECEQPNEKREERRASARCRAWCLRPRLGRPGCRVILAEEPADRARSLEPESLGARRPPKRRYRQQRIVDFGLRVQPVTPPAYPSGWSVS